jgi:hypothetical protein
MRLLRTDYRGRGRWAVVAKAFNAIGECFNRIEGENGVDVYQVGGVLRISGAGDGGTASAFPWHKLAFGYSLSGTTCTIYPGAIRLHGLAIYPLTEATDVTLTGSEPYVYLSIAVNAATGTAPTVAVSASEPVSTASTLRIPLFTFTLISGSNYAMQDIHNLGDINNFAVLR